MTEDARGEAERIVYEEVEQRYRTERLVAALAAAIEETDAEDEDSLGRMTSARINRRIAVAALRARAGEETG